MKIIFLSNLRDRLLKKTETGKLKCFPSLEKNFVSKTNGT